MTPPVARFHNVLSICHGMKLPFTNRCRCGKPDLCFSNTAINSKVSKRLCRDSARRSARSPFFKACAASSGVGWSLLDTVSVRSARGAPARAMAMTRRRFAWWQCSHDQRLQRTGAASPPVASGLTAISGVHRGVIGKSGALSGLREGREDQSGSLAFFFRWDGAARCGHHSPA